MDTMTRSQWFSPTFARLRAFAWLALAGTPLIAVAFALNIPALGFPSILLIFPLFVYLALIPVFHWRERYVGQKANVWGAWLVLETSGWSKIYYWYRHVLPDFRAQGRYTDQL